MKNKINIVGGRNIQIHTENRFIISCGIGAGHYCDNQNADFDAPTEPTSTMEVGIMYDESHSSHNPDEGYGCHFVCIPSDVVGWIPAGNLGQLIEAVRMNDWERVLLLCGFHEEPDFDSFPDRHQEEVSNV